MYNLNKFSITACFVISIVLLGCKKNLEIDDITADNFQKLLISTANYSIDEFDSGLSHIGGHLGMDRSAKDYLSSSSSSWRISNYITGLGYRFVSFNSLVTPEQYSLTFFNPDKDKIGWATFLFMPVHKYRADLNALLKHYGYIYKETDLKAGKDVLLKKVRDNVFIVIETEEYEGISINSPPSGYFKFGIYEIR